MQALQSEVHRKLDVRGYVAQDRDETENDARRLVPLARSERAQPGIERTNSFLRDTMSLTLGRIRHLRKFSHVGRNLHRYHDVRLIPDNFVLHALHD